MLAEHRGGRVWLFDLVWIIAIRLLSKLTGQHSFSAVFSHRQGKSTQHFRILLRPNGLAMVRFGQTVSRKVCRTAVGRNYMKRSCRELIRYQVERLVGMDVVLVHKLEFTPQDWQKIQGEIEFLVGYCQKCRESYSFSSTSTNSV
ncbi:MAG: ribonuclease P protein component [Ferrovum sp.]|nr:ribonuclease P protein component [Ferrovum sp.]